MLKSVMEGGVCWGGFEVSLFPVGFVVLRMEKGTFLGRCTFPPLVDMRENQEFHDLIRMDKAHWPRCLLWHGWLPVLSWAADASQSAGNMIEVALGSFSSGLITEWSVPEGVDLLKLLLGCLMFLMSELMAALFLIKSRLSPLLTRVFLLISLNFAGGSACGVMLIRFMLMVLFRPVLVHAVRDRAMLPGPPAI